jgi:hypothetical protein
LIDPNAANGVFGTSLTGRPLTANDITPANSPLWAILNARANGVPPFGNVTIPGGAQAGTIWPAMPTGSPPAWMEFQIGASPNLVGVFGNWISNGQIKDIPNGVIGAKPAAPIPGPLDSGKALFVCSMPGDTGVRPGVPPNFWATSLIFLVDPQTGDTVTPSTLTANSEYYLVAVIGNRGNTSAGRFISQPPRVEAAASVMVWNTTTSPGVQLPSLSNLDVNATSGLYEQYFLRSGDYDIAGWRLNVQTVFNGIVAALDDALADDPMLLGGVSPADWVKGQPAHLCAKVVIRGETNGQAFPNFGESPDTNRRIAQKNLAPFEVMLVATDPNPNIIWKTFIVGQPLFFRLNQKNEGRNRLVLDQRLPEKATQVYLAIPTRVFDGFVQKAGGLKGFDVINAEKLPSVGRYHGKPFPDAVILRQTKRDATIQLPPLEERELLGMAVGIEYDRNKIKHGPLGDLTIVQHTVVPILKAGTKCFELAERVVGGFTLQAYATEMEDYGKAGAHGSRAARR